ncbi:hypothetical protein CELL_01702 [Cellulomonas sp. T2.31MG-18]
MSTRARTHYQTGRLAPLVPLAAALLLAACAPNPTPTPTPTAPSPSVTPTSLLPAPAPSPTQPAEMAHDDETGAAAAGAFFITQLYPYTVSSQDTASWDKFSAEICSFCKSLKSSVVAEKDANQQTRPGAISIKSQKLGIIDPLRYRIDLEVSQEADVTYSSDGLVAGGRPARTIGLAVLVVRNPGQWLIGGIQVLTVNGVAQ